MKECRKCGEKKGLCEYYVHKDMLDGHLNICKKCVKKRTRDYRINNYETCKKIDRKKYLKRREAALKRQSEYARENEKQKYIGWIGNILRRAIRKGAMKKHPCSVCGEKKSQAHHSNYLEPYNVIWFCDYHHKQWHRGNKPVYPKNLVRDIKTLNT
jgi:hypothetical protein